MKKILFCLSWLILATACDKVTDLQPETALPAASGVPQEVINAARQTFPQLKTATFSAVIKDQTWRVDFKANGTYIAFFSNNGKFYNAYRQIAETDLTPVIRQTVRNQGASVQTAFEDLSASQSVKGYVTQLQTAKQTIATAYFDPLGAMMFTSTATTSLLSTASSETDYNVYIIPPDELPDNIKTYISQTFNGSTILKSAVSITNGVKQYLVYGSVSGGSFELTFNEAGAVTKTMVYMPVPSGQGGPISGQDAILTQTNMPASVITWLNQNYPNWIFQKAARTPTSINLNIEVDKKTYSLVFDLNWNFVSAWSIGSVIGSLPDNGSPGTPGTPNSAVPLKESDLPASVKDFLNQTYPGWVFKEGNKIEDQITIIIEANGRYSLSFDTDGKLLKTVKIS